MKFTIVTIDIDSNPTIYQTRSLKKAHEIYDNAIKHGVYVETFTDGYGSDMRDRQDEVSTIGWSE